MSDMNGHSKIIQKENKKCHGHGVLTLKVTVYCSEKSPSFPSLSI